MNPEYSAALAAYEKFDFAADGWTREVYRRGAGPAVIIIHEIPGLHPLVVRFADRVAAAGMTVYLPSLFGEPGRPVTANTGPAHAAALPGRPAGPRLAERRIRTPPPVPPAIAAPGHDPVRGGCVCVCGGRLCSRRTRRRRGC